MPVHKLYPPKILVPAFIGAICLLLFGQTFLFGAEWEEFGRLTSPRASVSAVRLDADRVMVMGGFDADRMSVKTVEILDLNSRTVSRAADMNVARAEFVALRGEDGMVYAVGGAPPGLAGATPSVERYDPETNEWTEIGELLLARRQFVAYFISATEILVVGGDASDLIARAHCEIFDITDGSSTRIADYPTRINEHVGGLTSFGVSYVAAGRTGGKDSDRSADVNSYVRNGDVWLKISELDASGARAAGTHLRRGNAIVSGGVLKESGLELLDDIYLENQNVFSNIADLLTPRFGHGMAQWSSDSVLIAGGFNGEGEALNGTEWLNVNRRSVSEGPDMDVERGTFVLMDAASFTPRGNLRVKRILAIGGQDTDGTPDDLIEVMEELAPEIPPVPHVINFYAAVRNIQPCPARLTVSSLSGFERGDRIAIIQMQGGTFNTDPDSPQFGQILEASAGQWEYAEIAAIEGSDIVLENTLVNDYDLSGAIQIVSVPEFDVLEVFDPIIALPWNGRTGGVIAFKANEVKLYEDIDAGGTGFRGGSANSGKPVVEHRAEYAAARGAQFAGRGEGIGGFGPEGLQGGRNSFATGGGGGNSYKAGGGGGGTLGRTITTRQFGQGGFGEINGLALGSPQNAAGRGGSGANLSGNLLIAGGGGGAGHADGGVSSSGARGGGIILIEAESILSAGGMLKSDGDDAVAAVDNGGGGGGAGGTVAVFAGEYTGDTLYISARGGRGADVMINGLTQRRTGPGGGGQGGRYVAAVGSNSFRFHADHSPGQNGLFTSQFAHGAIEGGAVGSEFHTTINSDIPNDALELDINITESEICIGDDLVFEAAVRGAGDGLVYEWKPEEAFFSIDGATAVFRGLQPGGTELSLTVRDATGCEQYAEMYVATEDCKRCDEISGIINDYYEITSIDYSSRSVTMSGDVAAARGDKFLLIQMQGAAIVPEDNDDYGRVINSQGAGDYEFVEVRFRDYDADGDVTTLRFRDDFVRPRYDAASSLQLIRTPEYNHVTVSGPVAAAEWNGKTGGVVALLADCVLLEADIDVSELGFRGGEKIKQVDCNLTPNDVDFATDELCHTSPKGEGIAGFGLDGKVYGRGAPGNAGGGGNNHNAGGGGGANFGNGGDGGYGVPDRDNNKIAGGVAGYALSPQYGVNAGKAYLGGGGGAGHINHGNGSGGARGGGIVIIRSGSIRTETLRTITANGGKAGDDTAPLNPDGCGGGGAGGTVVLDADVLEGALAVNALGGSGGSQLGGSSQFAGPGGGGGGGVLITGARLETDNITAELKGGAEGTIPPREEFPGATRGGDGAQLRMSSIVSGTDLGEYQNCRGCRPVVINVDASCGVRVVEFLDQSITIEQILLAPSANAKLELLDALPANLASVRVETVDPALGGTFELIARNSDGREVRISGTLEASPEATLSQPDVNDERLLRVEPGADAYQWYRDGFRLSGNAARRQEFNADFPGDYYADIFFENGCEARSDTISFEIETAVDEAPEADFAVRLYPNPVLSTLNLEVEDGGEALDLQIVDLLGRQVMRRGYAAGSTGSVISLDLNALPPGGYRLIVKRAAGTRVLPLIKQ